MTQRKTPGRHHSQRSWQQSFLVQSVTCLGGFSLLSSSLALAQAESAVDTIVPTQETPKPSTEGAVKVPERSSAAVAPPEQENPDFSARRNRLKRRLRGTEGSKPETSTQTPSRRERQRLEISTPETPIRRERQRLEISTPETPIRRERPRVELSKPDVNMPKPVGVTPPAASDRNSAYIDPTDYSIGATPTYQPPNSVVINNRNKRNCGTLANGQALGSAFCAPTAATPTRSQPLASSSDPKLKPSQPPSWLRQSQSLPVAGLTPPVTINRASLNAAISRRALSGNRVASLSVNPSLNRNIYRGYSGGMLGSVGVNPNAGFYSVPRSNAVGDLPMPTINGNMSPRPSNVPYNITLAPTPGSFGQFGNALATLNPSIIFPLSMPAPITSIFGWRIHPITGDQRFHSGTDIGAPMGTPVLAAYSGQVEVADFVGGYGLTVVLNHGNMQQTLYGHMSDIFVQPGQFVAQGTVIGRVGSTGNSTGPHLHFEVRQLTGEGWVAVDPGVQIESALGMLMQTLQTTQLSAQPTDSSPQQANLPPNS